jgi:hypothetical protein
MHIKPARIDEPRVGCQIDYYLKGIALVLLKNKATIEHNQLYKIETFIAYFFSSGLFCNIDIF